MSSRSLIPFIAMTGNIDREHLEKTMAGYRRVGINDVMIYPRTGLDLDYMSEDWRDAVGFCIEYAKKNEMRVWLYDELNWPSGICNHQVLYADDNNYAKRFVVEDGKVTVVQVGFTWDKSVWPFSGVGNDLTDLFKDKTRYFKRIFDPVTGKLLDVKYGLEITDEERSTPVNLVGFDAVDCFIKTTHEKYYEWFGEYFGNVIPGVFTDEPSFKHIKGSSQYPCFLYYDGIMEDYKATYGDDLLEDMVNHTKKLPDNNFQQRHLELCAKRFKETFIDHIREWCNSHNLKYTGHMVCDDSVTDSIYANGNILHTLSGFDIPGVDEIYTRLTYKDSFLGLPASAGATIDFLYSQLEYLKRGGHRETMVELFALGPYNMPFAQRARAVWFAASFGINHYFAAMAHLNASGNFLRNEYFMNLSYATNDFEGIAAVADEALKAVEYADKKFRARVCLRYPYTSSMNNVGKKDITDYDFLMKDCIQLLGENQIQWRMINEGDKADTDVVISFDAYGILDEKTGVYYKEAADWFAAISDKLDRDITVTEMSGALARDVFVRSYEDGSFLVINRCDTFGSERNLILNKDGERKIFRMYDYGVYHGEEQESLCLCEEILPENLKLDFNGFPQYTRINLMDSQSFRFETEEDIEAVLNICVYPEKRDVYLDGERIEYNLPETAFTDTFNALYMRSEPILFEKGKHVLTVPEFGRAFLPMLVLEGDVTVVDGINKQNKPAKLLVKKTRSDKPYTDQPFYGNASLHFDIAVPEGGANAVVDDFHGYVEAYVDGQQVKKISIPPYTFPIDEVYSGKTVHCEIKYYSSYEMLFGSVAEIEKAGCDFRADWVKLLSPPEAKIETVGFNNLHIYKK